MTIGFGDLSAPPLLILGMHRSGTSALSLALERLGVWMGGDLEGNRESRFFIRANQRLLRQAGATWADPKPFLHRWADESVRPQLIETARNLLASAGRRAYLGNAANGGSTARNWGWKDPRNTFTLPVWTAIFPQARIIHVRRSEERVVTSFRRRQKRSWGHRLMKTPAGLLLRMTGLLPRLSGSYPTLQPFSKERIGRLWQTYIETAEGHVRALGPRALTLEYEQLLANPVETVRHVAAFAALPSDADVQGAAYLLRKNPKET